MKPLNKFLSVAILHLAACQPCPTCPSSCPPCPTCAATAASVEGSPRFIGAADADSAAEKVSLPSMWFVVRAVDGDTLVVKQEIPDFAARKEYIRMLNINTPERGKPLADEATEALKTLVRAGDVRLEFKEPDVESRDHYGRLLAYVFAGDVNVNVEMVRQGWSTYWTEYGQSRYHEAFEAAQAEAKREKRGIHSLGETP